MNPPHSDNLGEVVRLFLRLGFTAFGGPAAHIAMMHDEVVVRRGWLTEQEFLDMVGATNLIPGPNSTEMAIHIGYERAGWRGLIAAGLCFILPAAFIVGTLAWAYVQYGSAPQGEALLYGIKPVIIAIVLQALYKLGRTAFKGPLLAAIGVVAFVLYLLGVNELVLLFGGGVLFMMLRMAQPNNAALLGLIPLAPTAEGAIRFQTEGVVNLGQLFLVFLKAGALLYGSGYVLLAFLRNDLVLRLGWLTDQQLLDAVAIGQFTPGPVFTTATFVGYLLAGVPGAVIATIGIFLPSFCFVAAIRPIVRSIRRAPWSAALLDGINAAALGLMVGVTWQLARAAIFDLPTVILALLSAFLIFHFNINSAWVVVGGGLVGLVLMAIQ